ncbi:PD-(D/E)XK nuclease superfamily protein [Catalinimonas alkaloidigena]|uniref:PD-(D/E)XK nuclease superfamily protein n=1 Tax=Catalinimonas alkaloidigena TaxID=1075417 RepID=A0A1G9R4J2_9BACT|nr:PD-(D/E)XK nuclease family protein [Catalinimonas alkaloidigena]SDM18232.1 PD-(D/E)XK nuclease superfamily protein [Catalinimonas alkaloidigena]
MERDLLPVESIQERDIDLLLLEELSTDASFCAWFFQELALPPFSNLLGAWKSISEFGLGETDILCAYESQGAPILLLLENKLDASFQEDQFARYLLRAQQYKTTQAYQEAYCVLVAPASFCQAQHAFDRFITYETIAQWLHQSGTPRGRFKSKLLQIAVQKQRRGYQPINSVSVQRFWQLYWHYREEHHARFRMKKPDLVPHNSDWPILRDEALLGILFYHKLAQGHVDATFRNFSDDLVRQLKNLLPPQAAVVQHNTYFSIRLATQPLDRTQDFHQQLAQVAQAFERLERLRAWLHRHQHLWGD